MDIQNIKNKLFDMYSEYTIQEVNEKNLVEISEDELIKNYEIKDYMEILLQVKKDIESIATTSQSNMDEIRKSLYLINSLIKSDRLNTARELIAQCFYNKWTHEEKELYDEIYHNIVKWKDYFFSYTNRDAYQTNNDFKSHIKSSIKYKNDGKKNLVAKLIVKYLKKNNLSYFFDIDNMKCGDNIQDEIFKYCKKSFTFVQLIEDVSFEKPEKNKNWCYKEYKFFKQHRKKLPEATYKTNFFILTNPPEKLKPARLPEEYKEWYDEIAEKLFICLEDINNKKELRDKVKELSNEIYNSTIRIREFLIEQINS